MWKEQAATFKELAPSGGKVIQGGNSSSRPRNREQGFVPPPADSPLALLQGKRLAGGRLRVLQGPANRVGARYFRLTWQGQQGQSPMLTGLCRQGSYPGANWIEIIALDPKAPSKGETLGLTEQELLRLFTLLCEIIPPGGHLMCEYESPQWAQTLAALAQGMPPVLTSLGCLMFQAGCQGGFKDWYISEGWTEGPRKLQGFRPLDEAHRRQKALELAQGLHDFLSSERGRLVLRGDPKALGRALEVLGSLPLEDPELIAGLGDALGRLQGREGVKTP